MKISLFLLSFLWSLVCFSQDNSCKVVLKDTALYNDIIRTNKNPKLLLTSRALNLFFTKRLSYYLTGESDLSFFKNYAILDVTDGKMELGKNWTIKDSNERVKHVLTAALKTNLVDNFAAIVKNKGLSEDMGISIKYTRPLPGSVWFNKKKNSINNQAGKMNHERIAIFAEFNQALIDEKIAFFQKHSILKNSPTVQFDSIFQTMYTSSDTCIEIPMFSTSQKDTCCKKDTCPDIKCIKINTKKAIWKAWKKKENELIEKYTTDFYEKEVDAVEDNENKLFNWSRLNWFTIKAYIPLTGISYNHTKSLNTAAINQPFIPWEVGFTFSGLKEIRDTHKYSNEIESFHERMKINERNRINRWFYSFGVGAFYNNAVKIEVDSIKKISKNQYQLINIDATNIYNMGLLESNDLYLGNYTQFVSAKLTAQGVFYPWQTQNMGIDVFAEGIFNVGQAKSFYTNVGAGLPFRLASKEEDKFINFELLATLKDALSITNITDIPNNVVLGIRTVLPFNSLKY